jgi:hypothetical protein
MIRGLLLILDAGGSWVKIAQAQRGYAFIFLVHLLPLMVVAFGVEAFAMTRLGEGRTITHDMISVSQPAAVRFAIASIALNLGVILFGALLVRHIARSFHNFINYLTCFCMLAYTLSPLYLAHLLDALPGLNTWLCFGIGMFLSLAVLYLGIPNVMRPDPAKAMGIYLIISVMLIVLCGLAHFLAIQILHDRLNLNFWQQLL